MNKAELLDEVRAGRQRLEATLARLDDDQMLSPGLGNGWSVKDLIAHFGFWEETAATLYEQLTRGETPGGWELDAVNARVYAEHRDQSLADVRQFEQAAYERLVQTAEQASEADLFDAKRFPWTQGNPFYTFIADNSYGHFDEHLPQLLAYVETITPAGE